MTGEQSTLCHVPHIVLLWSKYFCPGDEWVERPSVTAELTIVYFVYIFQDDRSVWDRAGLPVAIYRLIASGTFGPEEIKAMAAAYEGALIDLQLIDRNDPLTELIAKAIVNVTATGERDPENIKERALNALGVRRTAA